MQGAHIVDADVAEAVARYIKMLRGADAASITAASFRFTPDMMAPMWQVIPLSVHMHPVLACVQMVFRGDLIVMLHPVGSSLSANCCACLQHFVQSGIGQTRHDSLHSCRWQETVTQIRTLLEGTSGQGEAQAHSRVTQIVQAFHEVR